MFLAATFVRQIEDLAICLQKLDSHCFHDTKFSHFYTIPTCETDTHTHRGTRQLPIPR